MNNFNWYFEVFNLIQAILYNGFSIITDMYVDKITIAEISSYSIWFSDNLRDKTISIKNINIICTIKKIIIYLIIYIHCNMRHINVNKQLNNIFSAKINQSVIN